MSGHCSLERLLGCLGLQAGATQPAEADETVALRYADGLICVLAMDVGGGLLASTPIAFIHESSRLPLFEKALRLNGSREQAHEGVIGYDAVLSQLEYSIRIPADALDDETFPSKLARFMQCAVALRARLAEQGASIKPPVKVRTATL
ncbi:CesT family type III secretion system chaperone [Peristeroidobacter soli]|uniref:CesT family type III secretion system chaperone n=1 Tax=Peristeroidobacter soli TaxID=2497877 RepID=UPI00101DA5C5|nr:CesT family type III secretion system chaperone [Peristeroidobacter soli]